VVMKQDFLIIAEALGYKKLQRLRHAGEKVDSDVLLDMIKSSIVDPYAILFFHGRCYQITPYGVNFAHALSRNDRNYLIAFPDLNEKFLREVFTGFELVLYKICHIVLEDQKAEYHWETQKTRKRFKRLRTLLAMQDWKDFERLFDNIFFVRDAFAHSFVSLEDIKYDDVPLRDCFGDSYLGHTRRESEVHGARIFTDDLTKLFEPIIKLFCEHQLKQIDARKLHKLCDRLLMQRSMSPGP
jgi:hypothetical protein